MRDADGLNRIEPVCDRSLDAVSVLPHGTALLGKNPYATDREKTEVDLVAA